MPLWDFHTTKGLITTSEKQQLAREINKLYTASGLPPFYINVRFTEHDSENIYSGGEALPTIIIRIEHLARAFVDLEHKKSFRARADAILNPVLETKSVIWEYAVTTIDRDTWEINGFVPPLPETEAEKMWKEKNWPFEFDEADNVRRS